MDKVSASQLRDRWYEPHTGHDHDSSYDTSTGQFQEADLRVINISCQNLFHNQAKINLVKTKGILILKGLQNDFKFSVITYIHGGKTKKFSFLWCGLEVSAFDFLAKIFSICLLSLTDMFRSTNDACDGRICCIEEESRL